MLIENVQRKDLNPIEEAQAYRRLIVEVGLTQEEISERVGKSRPFIANSLRLLQLPQEVQAFIAKGFLSAGHGKALLGIPDPAKQRKLAEEVIRRGLSVRETEREVRRLAGAAKPVAKPGRKAAAEKNPELADVEDRLRRLLGTRVRIAMSGRGGRIEIEFSSQEELNRLLELLMGDST